MLVDVAESGGLAIGKSLHIPCELAAPDTVRPDGLALRRCGRRFVSRVALALWHVHLCSVLLIRW